LLLRSSSQPGRQLPYKRPATEKLNPDSQWVSNHESVSVATEDDGQRPRADSSGTITFPDSRSRAIKSQAPGTETAGELRGPAVVYASTFELGWGGDPAPVSPAWQDDRQCSRPATPLRESPPAATRVAGAQKLGWPRPRLYTRVPSNSGGRGPGTGFSCLVG